jgi:mycothiol system anti-sigma-R factor
VSNKESTALRCAGVQRFVDTYLDGEFAETDRAEFEAHLAECESCKARVRAQAGWKQAIKRAAPHESAPAALRNRVKRAIAKEAAPPLSWRRWAVRVMPVAAATGLMATLVISKVQFSPVAADAVARHHSNLPIEVSGGTDQVKKWFGDKVDFPVRPPHLGAAALRGGRIANIRDRQAAYLVYDSGGNKVSVFIFDPGDLPMEAQRRQVIGNREVYFDQGRGYNVAMYRDHGVGYAIASDLDADQMFKLVSSAVAP